MKTLRILMSLAFVALAVSCDLEEKWNAMKNGDPTKGTEEMSSIDFGRFSVTDAADIEGKIERGRKVDYGKYSLTAFMSREKVQQMAEFSGATITSDQLAMMNAFDVDDARMLCRLTYQPFVARIDKVTVTSSDESVVSIDPTDDMLNFYMNLNGLGECDVKVVAEGINMKELNIHVRVTGRIDLLLYTDPFWLNNLTARLKYKTKALPKGIKSLYMNVRDTATVIGMARTIDQRNGDRTFVSIADTTRYPVNQHTDKFRKRKRVILRNVSDAVRLYNGDMYAYGYVKVSKEMAEELGAAGPNLRPEFSVKKVGESYDITMLGQTFRTDAYQLYWINRTIHLMGRWPADATLVEEDGQYYVRFTEPFITKQIRLGMEIIGNCPYLAFNIMMKASQSSSDSDEDEDDNADDFVNDAEEVVDSIGTKLKDYFVVEFIENMPQHRKDSLANVLDNLVKQTPDSLKWQLGY